MKLNIVTRFQWQLPTPLERTTSLLANAAIPAMLILLGLELQRAEWSKQLCALAVSGGVRLLVYLGS